MKRSIRRSVTSCSSYVKLNAGAKSGGDAWLPNCLSARTFRLSDSRRGDHQCGRDIENAVIDAAVSAPLQSKAYLDEADFPTVNKGVCLWR